MKKDSASSARDEQDDAMREKQSQQRHHQTEEDEELEQWNQDEEAYRKECKHPLMLMVVNLYSASVVFLAYMVSLESILGILLSVVATLYVYFFTSTNPARGEWYGGGMDFVLLSFAVITPMSASIGISFTRREAALLAMAKFRSCAHQIYLSHACWDWYNKEGHSGKHEKAAEEAWLAHADHALSHLISMADHLCRFLTLPSYTRARHRVTQPGRAQAKRAASLAQHHLDAIQIHHLSLLTNQTEHLKRCGLPANEASRIRQWERIVLESIESLRMIKTYRTPQALRSFARVFTLLLPPFYAPTYAQMARDMGHVGVALGFAVLTSLALTALFESISVLEDPFVAHLTLDGIDVREELQVLHWHQLMKFRDLYFPDATPFHAKTAALVPTLTKQDEHLEKSETEEETKPSEDEKDGDVVVMLPEKRLPGQEHEQKSEKDLNHVSRTSAYGHLRSFVE